MKYHREITGLIKSCTVSQVPSGKYYISILTESEIKELPKTNKKCWYRFRDKRFCNNVEW